MLPAVLVVGGLFGQLQAVHRGADDTGLAEGVVAEALLLHDGAGGAGAIDDRLRLAFALRAQPEWWNDATLHDPIPSASRPRDLTP
jgi:hypothetical protein